MVHYVSDPTVGCCESATRGPKQRRRLGCFITCVVLAFGTLVVLAWFGMHGEDLEADCVKRLVAAGELTVIKGPVTCRKCNGGLNCCESADLYANPGAAAQCRQAKTDWERWMPAVYVPMMLLWMMAFVCCWLVFCCGGSIEIDRKEKDSQPAEVVVQSELPRKPLSARHPQIAPTTWQGQEVEHWLQTTPAHQQFFSPRHAPVHAHEPPLLEKQPSSGRAQRNRDRHPQYPQGSMPFSSHTPLQDSVHRQHRDQYYIV